MNSTVSAIGALAIFAGAAFGQASFTSTGYTQNFNAMGTTGTTRPTGWSHWTSAAVSGANTVFNATTTNTQIAAALPAFTQRNVALSVQTQAGTAGFGTQAATATTAGYNVAFSSNTANRILGATSATGVAGTAIELAITNNSGAALSTIDFSYDWVAIATGPGQSGFTGNMLPGQESEIPGFRVFVSSNGSTGPWTNLTALNFAPPVSTAIGTTTVVSATGLVLPSAWGAGSTLTFRWFKDNENQASPDPLYGIDNISIVPTPGAAALLGLGALAAGRRRR